MMRAAVGAVPGAVRQRTGSTMFHPLHLVRDGGVDALAFEYTIVDVETTGLDPRRGHRVCEIAVVRVRGDGEVVEEFSSMVNPGRRIPREVAEYHGIGDADVAGAPSFGQLAGTLLRMARNAVVVAHNLPFEEAFLDAEFARLGLPLPKVPGLCTVTAFRSQLDWPAYRLSGSVRSLSGEWPRTEHVALADARNTASALTTLLTRAPLRLGLRPSPVWPSPSDLPDPSGLPDAARAVSRAYWAGHRGDLAALCRSLPLRTRMSPDPSAVAEYRSALETALAGGFHIDGDDAGELGDMMGAAGFDRRTVRAVHREVWRAAHRRVEAPVPDGTARALRWLAQDLDVPELVGELPPIHDELSGVRLVPRGDDADVRAVVAWAERHGASTSSRPSKTTSMIVTTDVERASRLKVVREHGILVLPPRDAEAELRRRVAAAAERPRRPEPDAEDARLVFPVPGPPTGWRDHEIPAELCEGAYVRPVRRLAEAAADPAVSQVRFGRDPRPTLTVHRGALSGELREGLEILRGRDGLVVEMVSGKASTPRP